MKAVHEDREPQLGKNDALEEESDIVRVRTPNGVGVHYNKLRHKYRVSFSLLETGSCRHEDWSNRFGELLTFFRYFLVAF